MYDLDTRALVACTHKLLLVNLSRHQVEVVEDHRGGYYGISWTEDGKRLCLSHSGRRYQELITLQDHALAEKGWVSVGDRHAEPFLLAPHQLLCVGDRIVATKYRAQLSDPYP